MKIEYHCHFCEIAFYDYPDLFRPLCRECYSNLTYMRPRHNLETMLSNKTLFTLEYEDSKKYEQELKRRN